ncbi:hypothetical protein U9M48_026896 [Paspalum notatum var. saurae]|uniref:C3H1-type domain-containing protein n=1 Tax=Paspalum notatum var. saurae TaxID=547442 RepID=A0AAQ3TVG2_PASNO
MDPHPPFDHQHHRRPHPGHHFLDHSHHHHNHHLPGGGGGGGGAAPARSRYDYEYDSHPIQYLPPPDHHLPRPHHQLPPPPPPLPPPPPPLPHHRHDGPHYAPLPLRSPPETYSPPPYHNPPPPHHPYHQQRHGGDDDFRATDEIRRLPIHHPLLAQHHHPPPPPHHHPQPQLSWEEAEEEEERRYAAQQLRVSPPPFRKRYRCSMHDSGDLESTSSSGPPPRRQRQQMHAGYSSPPPDDGFVESRATNYSGYSGHDGFVAHSDSNGNRKMPMPTPALLPSSPNSMGAGYPRRAPQKIAPARVSVWHRIEENPALYAPPSPRKVPKEVHISPNKTKNSGSGSKELASVVSVDCKAKSADCKDSSDSAGLKKSAVKKTEKVLSSVLVKPSPEAKEKERAVNKVTKKPAKVENNLPGFTSAVPGAGVKKVKKIVIKKIVRKIGAKDKQSSSSVVSEKDSVDANANASEKEEGEITTSSFEKDAISAHNLGNTSDTAAVGNSVEVQKEQNNDQVKLSTSNAASAIASTDTLDTSSASRQEHSGKENDKSFMNSIDGKSASFPCENKNKNSQNEEEGEILTVPSPVNVANNSTRMLDAVILHGCEVDNMEESKIPEVLSRNNAVDTTEVSGSGNGTREEGVSNDYIRRPIIDEVIMTASKDNREKEGLILMGASEVSVASLGNSEGVPKIAETAVTQGVRNEEGNKLNNPNDVASVRSCVAFNTADINVNENTQIKQCRTVIEPSESTSFAQHVKALNTLEISVNENIEKEGNVSKVVQNEAGKSLMDSNGMKVGSSDNTMYTPSFVVAGGTEDISMQNLLHDAKPAFNNPDIPVELKDTYFSYLHIGSTILPSLDDDPMKDSSGAVISNNGVGRSAASEVAELMHFHRSHQSPENNFSLHSHDSPSASGSSEHSVPTALTLGNNIYFSSAEGEEQPEENRNLVDVNQGFDDVKMTEFGSIDKRKSESGNDLMSAGVQNWLTLPLTASYLNNDATGSADRLDLDQALDEGASVCQDHDSMPDMDQHGSIDVCQDQNLNLCGSSTPQSDQLATKERKKDVENESEIILPGFSLRSVNVLDQYSYHTVDKPLDNPNKSILLPSKSADTPGGELASSQVHVDPDHTYHQNIEDPVAVSSTQPDPLSSWIEAIVSEAKNGHQSCKSTLLPISSPDKLLAPKEDSRKEVSDSVVSSVVKSPPRINITSSTVSKVPTKQAALSGSVREPPQLNPNARHRTWRRDIVSSSNSSLHVPQPSGLPPKLPVRKNVKSQNSYIRKGNALIRNPATGNHPHSSLDAQNKLNKPVMRRSLNFVRKVDLNDAVPHSRISVERPKTPPLPLHTKSINCAVNVSEPSSQNLQQQVLGTEKEDSSGQVNSGVDNPSIVSLQKSESLEAGKSVYARPKSNHLVAAQGQHPSDSSNSSMDKVMLLQPSTTSDLYFKKRKNQIILGSSTSNVTNAKGMSQAENMKSGESKALMFAPSNINITVANDRPHKALQTKNTVGSFSRVWTLSGQNPRRKSSVGISHMKVFPRILPWKRKLFFQNFSGSHSSLLNTSALGIVRKLLQTRKRSAIYTVSNGGFSLRKSGVLSIGGSSLKWSRSLEKHSQKVNEVPNLITAFLHFLFLGYQTRDLHSGLQEATLAVAEVERKKREKRKRQSLRNKGRTDQYSAPVAANQLINTNRASSNSGVSSTCDEYVRVNKGNQLVRNPKKVIRMLASEKVRWSLHTVIPERMPDCSYFLQGLCSNTACPYRHVKVNLNAPVCEDFLKGYCADGDECRKKHSYVCPVFEETGECPQESRCKLHHPKKKNKSKKSRVDTVQNNSWGRYFDTSIDHGSGARIVSSEEEGQKPEQVCCEDFADFIDLGADIEVAGDVDTSDDTQLMELDSGNLKMQAENLEERIKPLRIMRTARV